MGRSIHPCVLGLAINRDLNMENGQILFYYLCSRLLIFERLQTSRTWLKLKTRQDCRQVLTRLVGVHLHLLVRSFAPVSRVLEQVLGLRIHVCVVTAHIQVESVRPLVLHFSLIFYYKSESIEI